MATEKFRHYSRVFKPTDAESNPLPLTPPQVAKAYNFPPGQNLQNRHIAFIELCDETTFDKTNVDSYLSKLGIPAGKMFFYTIDGAGDAILPQDADGEVELDQCVAMSVAPGVNAHTIFASNTDQGFADAITYAATKLPVKPDSITISWGAPESQWEPASLSLMNAAINAAKAMGIGVYVAAGDSGSSDGIDDGMNHVDFPASSDGVTACGGTRLILNPDGSRSFEKVWSLADGNGATGGGVSDVYPPLPCQPKTQLQRSVPDIAGNADPMSGYEVKVDGADQVIGGTSAVAPLFAALHAILQSYFVEPIGNLNSIFYALSDTDYFDVVVGNNGAFSATPGYDLCSGVGVPDGTAMLNYLVKSGLTLVSADNEKGVSKVQSAVQLALHGHKHIFGHYSLSIADIEQIVEMVIRVLGTVSTPNCQTCINELIADVSSGS